MGLVIIRLGLPRHAFYVICGNDGECSGLWNIGCMKIEHPSSRQLKPDDTQV